MKRWLAQKRNGCALAAFVVGILGFAYGGSQLANEDLDVWIEALSTLAAFMAAFIAAGYAARIFGLERGRDVAAAQARERVQADQIAAWGTTSLAGETVWCDMKVRNTSLLPVYGVSLRLRIMLQHQVGTETVEKLHKLPSPILAPGSEEGAAVSHDFGTGIVRVSDRGAVRGSGVAVDIRFRDAAGTWWLRTADGGLEHAPDPLKVNH